MSQPCIQNLIASDTIMTKTIMTIMMKMIMTKTNTIMRKTNMIMTKTTNTITTIPKYRKIPWQIQKSHDFKYD